MKLTIVILPLLLAIALLVVALPLMSACGDDGGGLSEVQEHLDKGWEYIGEGRFDDAIAEYTKAIEIDPNLATVYVSRGELYQYQHDYQRAIKDFDEAVRLSPGGSHYYYRGIAYYDMGQLQRAIEDFDEAIRLDPQYAFLSYYQRGDAYYDLADYQQAVEDYSEAIRLWPEGAGFDVYYSRAEAYIALGNDQEAERDIEKVVELGGDADWLRAAVKELKAQR